MPPPFVVHPLHSVVLCSLCVPAVANNKLKCGWITEVVGSIGGVGVGFIPADTIASACYGSL